VPDVLASLRPTSFDVPLFLHVLGAMVLVGALLGALLALVYQWRPAAEAGPTLRRFAFRALLAFAVPAFFAMRVGAQWIYSKEFPDGSGPDPTWVKIGLMVSDVGGLLLIAACIVAWRAAKKAATGGLARAATILTALILVMDLVAMWAMTAKPS
jgi:hypothetical protein